MWSRPIGSDLAFGFAMMLAVMQSHAQMYVAGATAPIAPHSTGARSHGLAPARVRMLDDDVQLVAPGGPVMLAQEFELRLEGETTSLNRVSVTQWAASPDGQWHEVYQGFASGPAERRGDAMVVKVVPYQLGKVQLRVAGSGKVGEQLATLHKEVLVDVTPPPAGPVELRFGQVQRNAWEEAADARMMTARLGLKGKAKPLQMNFSVEAIYNGVLESQPVDAREVRYQVWTGNQGAVIWLDPQTGSVRGLKSGHALVEATYGGVTRQACVVVEQHAGTACGDLGGR